MARKPFGDPTLGGAGSIRPYEENTGTKQDWKPVQGQRTEEAGGWGGKGYEYDIVNGTPYARPGTRISDEDVDRYRKLGAQRRDAVQLDLTQADETKRLQLGSLARLSTAARGGAPSRAATLGQIGTEDAIRANRTTAPGALGARAAMRGLSNQAGTTAAQVGDMRAGEMGRARNEYFGAATGMRKQDIGTSVTNAQLEAANRDMEQKRQLQYEQLGWDTRNAEMFGMVEQRGQEEDAWQREQEIRHAKSESDRGVVKDFASAGFGFLGGAMSDRRSKNVMTYGSLAGIGRR